MGLNMEREANWADQPGIREALAIPMERWPANILESARQSFKELDPEHPAYDPTLGGDLETLILNVQRESMEEEDMGPATHLQRTLMAFCEGYAYALKKVGVGRRTVRKKAVRRKASGRKRSKASPAVVVRGPGVA